MNNSSRGLNWTSSGGWTRLSGQLLQSKNMSPTIQWLLSALGGAVIALVGNFALQGRLRTWQREQWLLDHKTAEYRELLSGLAESVQCMARNSPDFGMPVGSHEDAQRDAYEQAASKGKAIILDRLFVAKLIADQRILERWQLLAGERDLSRFWGYWESVHRTIVQAARKDLGVKGELPQEL